MLVLNIYFLYYCDEKFPYIHSDIEKAIYRLEKIRNNKDNVFQNLTDNHISFIGKDENYVPLQKKIERINSYLK